ncbi:hypothetical protein [Streptomyces sp. NPDC085932]|uniref:hypothetical protein n=1 Tax=Streptomyces sp. NPDC085932 TaxID=3365741 RepID=UPI0037D2ED8D
MPSARDAVREGVLRAVNSAIERSWEIDRFTLEGGLRAALADETGLPHSEAVRHVFQQYGPPLTRLVVRYTGSDPQRFPDEAARAAAEADLHETVEALTRDLLQVLPWLAEHSTQSPAYTSPVVHGAAHHIPHVVVTQKAVNDFVPEADDDAPVHDGSPGVVARRRARRATRALEEARRSIGAVDWENAEEWNGRLLASLRVHQRMAVLWVENLERVVIGQDNPAHGVLAALTGVAGAGVYAGSVQRGPDKGKLRRTRTARVTGLPPEAGEAVCMELAAYRFSTAFVAATPWER